MSASVGGHHGACRRPARRGGGARWRARRSSSRDAEILERAAEEHRRQMALAERLQVERACTASRTSSSSPPITAASRFGIERRQLRGSSCSRQLAGSMPVVAASSRRTLAEQIVMVPTKSRPRADRPADRRGVERQRLLDLVDQVERVAALAVELVDEGDDRHVAQPADLEQLAGLRLDAAWRRRSP